MKPHLSEGPFMPLGRSPGNATDSATKSSEARHVRNGPFFEEAQWAALATTRPRPDLALPLLIWLAAQPSSGIAVAIGTVDFLTLTQKPLGL